MITLNGNPSGVTFDGVPIPVACRKLEEAGATVVGVNSARGPDTMIPLIKEVRKACKVIDGYNSCSSVLLRWFPEDK